MPNPARDFQSLVTVASPVINPPVTYSNKLLKLNPILYMPLWEATGTTATCLVNPLQNGTYHGVSLANALSPNGKPCPLFGVPDYVDIFTSALTSALNTEEGTISFFAKVANASQWVSGYYYAFSLRQNNDNRIAGGILEPRLEAAHFHAATEHWTYLTVAPTDWFHVTFTWSVTKGLATIHYNGGEYNFSDIGTYTAWAGDLATAVIGDFYGAYGYGWVGWMSDFATFDYALSSSQIQDISVASGNPERVLFTAGHETGDITEWSENRVSSPDTSVAPATVVFDTDYAHSGSYAAHYTAPDIDANQREARLSRTEFMREGYCSAWHLYPVIPTVANTVSSWLVVSQIKVGEIVYPPYIIYAKTIDGSTYLQLRTADDPSWAANEDIAPNVNSPPALVAEEWFQIEWYYKCGTTDGALKIWQNGLLIWDLSNINTLYGEEPWIIFIPSLYGNGVTPSTLEMYVDDVVISTRRVGTG